MRTINTGPYRAVKPVLEPPAVKTDTDGDSDADGDADIDADGDSDTLRERFSGLARARERSPREEVIDILAEGLWTLICQGRGPAAGKFRTIRDDNIDLLDHDRDTAAKGTAHD
jgi:hypothetical protein